MVKPGIASVMVFFLSSLAPEGFAATITVDPSGGGDHTDIQAALDAAGDGDTVLVRPGEYVLRMPLDFNRLRDPGDPDEGVPPEGPPLKNLTVVGDGPADTVVLRMGTPLDGGRASVVVFRCGEGPSSVLDGFTLTGGSGFLTSENSLAGGGICCIRSSPTIRRCIVSHNEADIGGGLFSTAAAPTIQSSEVLGNRANTGGGLVYRWCDSPAILDCDIHHNEEGGVLILGGDLRIASSMIRENRKDADYGGGAGLAVFDGTVLLESCAIFKNEAWASGRGGAMELYEGSATVVNCTIVGNRADESGGGIYACGSLRLLNSIVLGNGEDIVLDPYLECGSSLEASHCLLADPGLGVECIGGDPLFADPVILDFTQPGGDWRLLAGSPCIDAGTSDGAPATDIEGNERPCGNGVDIGAYEFQDCPAQGTPFVRGNVDGKGGIDLSDPVFLLTHLFLGEKTPDCLDAGDANDDGDLDLSDAVYSLSFQFLGGAQPASPFPECGIDPSIDGLDCRLYPNCR